jgi:hypothetical protein
VLHPGKPRWPGGLQAAIARACRAPPYGSERRWPPCGWARRQRRRGPHRAAAARPRAVLQLQRQGQRRRPRAGRQRPRVEHLGRPPAPVRAAAGAGHPPGDQQLAAGVEKCELPQVGVRARSQVVLHQDVVGADHDRPHAVADDQVGPRAAGGHVRAEPGTRPLQRGPAELVQGAAAQGPGEAAGRVRRENAVSRRRVDVQGVGVEHLAQPAQLADQVGQAAAVDGLRHAVESRGETPTQVAAGQHATGQDAPRSSSSASSRSGPQVGSAATWSRSLRRGSWRPSQRVRRRLVSGPGDSTGTCSSRATSSTSRVVGRV